MVDSPQGPAGLPEKPVEAIVVNDPLERLRRKLPPPPPESLKMMEWFCGWLPVCLGVCGLALSILLLIGWGILMLAALSGQTGFAVIAFGCFLGPALFFGPLLWGIAGILHRLNLRKRD